MSGYVICCPNGIVGLKEFATREQAESALDSVAQLDGCAWRRDELFVREAAPGDRQQLEQPS